MNQEPQKFVSPLRKFSTHFSVDPACLHSIQSISPGKSSLFAQMFNQGATLRPIILLKYLGALGADMSLCHEKC